MNSALIDRPISKIANIRKLVENLVMSAPFKYMPSKSEAIIAKGVERYLYLEDHGLKVCRHINGDIFGFVLTRLELNPYVVGRYIDSITHGGFLVNTDYYGEENAPKAIDYGFTDADLHSVFFVVETSDPGRMPGHERNIPGSICCGTCWGKERDEKFASFAAEFAETDKIEIRAVNALSHGLIVFHDLQREKYFCCLDTLGQDNHYIDYIQQPYNLNGFCPSGYLGQHGIMNWSVRYGYVDYPHFAAVCLAR